MRFEAHIIELTERGIRARIGGVEMWLPKCGPGIEWTGDVEIDGMAYLRAPGWLIGKHRALQELQYQRALSFNPPAGLDPAKAKGLLPMSDYTPSFPLTRLYRKASKEGKTYFTGRLGGARIALLRSKDTAEDGGEIWNLVVSEAPKRDDAGSQRPTEPRPNAYAEAKGVELRHQESAGGMSPFDDKIPFAPDR
jgi:hypothetical protein